MTSYVVKINQYSGSQVDFIEKENDPKSLEYLHEIKDLCNMATSCKSI